MSFQEIEYAVTDRVATITLNRPEKLNALTKLMEEELFEAMTRANNDSEVRVIILTGAGKGFCSGADISLLQSITSEDFQNTPPETIFQKYVPNREVGDHQKDFQRCWSYFPSIEKPIIAAINGPAVGLGFILTLFCDIRFSAENARFSTAFSKRGLIAEHGISWILPRLAGISNALDLLFSARMISASEAQSMNLTSRTFSSETLLEEVQSYANDLAQNVSPRSLRLMKREVYKAQLQSLDEAIDDANRDMLDSFSCDDFKEGVAHFVEKRPARFTGQ
jgi:enoyl-CoA hydratase/carnithine racemase